MTTRTEHGLGLDGFGVNPTRETVWSVSVFQNPTQWVCNGFGFTVSWGGFTGSRVLGFNPWDLGLGLNPWTEKVEVNKTEAEAMGGVERDRETYDGVIAELGKRKSKRYKCQKKELRNNRLDIARVIHVISRLVTTRHILLQRSHKFLKKLQAIELKVDDQ
ncbi:hypothetical protein LXL04_018450 [Taraxacum kok-saghyz]